MLSAARALQLHGDDAPDLPHVPAFKALYDYGLSAKRGDVIMVAGRSGSQKSGFAMYWVEQMGLPTLYFAADMKPVEASARLAAIRTGENSRTIRKRIEASGPDLYVDALRDSKVSFAFGQPITWHTIDLTLQGWVETYNSYPEVIVIDNLMDIQSVGADYTLMSEAMQALDALAQDTGATVIILHHATDKGGGSGDPGLPPARSEIKYGMSEKPQVILTVALAAQMLPYELRIAHVKQREGRADPSGRDYVRIGARPETTTFFDLREEQHHGY